MLDPMITREQECVPVFLMSRSRNSPVDCGCFRNRGLGCLDRASARARRGAAGSVGGSGGHQWTTEVNVRVT